LSVITADCWSSRSASSAVHTCRGRIQAGPRLSTALQAWKTSIPSATPIGEGERRDRADNGKGGYLVSKNTYKDFQVKAEFWADTTTNSGVFIRCTDPNKVTATNCLRGERLRLRPDPSYGTGAIVNVAKVLAHAESRGRWNTYEITAKGSQLTVVLNGSRRQCSRQPVCARTLGAPVRPRPKTSGAGPSSGERCRSRRYSLPRYSIQELQHQRGSGLLRLSVGKHVQYSAFGNILPGTSPRGRVRGIVSGNDERGISERSRSSGSAPGKCPDSYAKLDVESTRSSSPTCAHASRSGHFPGADPETCCAPRSPRSSFRTRCLARDLGARYLEDVCRRRSTGTCSDGQTEQTAPARVLEFLNRVTR